MNEWLQKLLEQVKTLWGKWSVTQKVVLFAVIGAGILAVVLLFAFSAAPSMAPLISSPVKDEDTRSRIATKLDETGIKYTIRADNMIMVPDEKTARKARMILNEADLIPKGTDPWALFDIERWTITDFERDVNLQRSITKQLEQHILALDDVDNVNVTLVVPKTELFVEDQNPTTASVIITPKPGSDFATNRKKIEGVQRLIKVAVAGLKDENIVIADNNGIQLNDFAGLEDIDQLELAKRQLKEKQALEVKYRAEIMKSLSAIFTADRVSIPKIDIDLDMSKKNVEITEHPPVMTRPATKYEAAAYAPNVAISESNLLEDFQGTGYNPEGPAGVEGQTPPAYKDLSNLVGKYSKSEKKTNYEVNTTKTTEQKRPWVINRITVGFALDGIWKKQYDKFGTPLLNPDGSLKRDFAPVSDEEIQRAKQLIQGAIGYDKTRGDVVEAVQFQFDRTAQFEKEDATFRASMNLRRTLIAIGIAIGAILVIAFLYRLLAKEMERRRRLREEELARQHQAMREAALRTAEEQGISVELSVEERARLEMQENALNMAREHPEDVAQLIRTWLVEE